MYQFFENISWVNPDLHNVYMMFCEFHGTHQKQLMGKTYKGTNIYSPGGRGWSFCRGQIIYFNPAWRARWTFHILLHVYIEHLLNCWSKLFILRSRLFIWKTKSSPLLLDFNSTPYLLKNCIYLHQNHPWWYRHISILVFSVDQHNTDDIVLRRCDSLLWDNFLICPRMFK